MTQDDMTMILAYGMATGALIKIADEMDVAQ